MTGLEDIPQPTRDAAIAVACPGFETRPSVVGPPRARRRVAIVSSAALVRRGDKPFPFGAPSAGSRLDGPAALALGSRSAAAAEVTLPPLLGRLRSSAQGFIPAD